MQYIDLSHPFTDKMPVYPGEPKVTLELIDTFDETGYNNSQVTTGVHVGTHMDAPNHLVKDGEKLTDYPVSTFFGKTHLIDARGKKEIGIELLENNEIAAEDIVIIMTGLSEKYGEESYYTEYPPFTEEFAEKLAELKIKMVGMDTPSPDYAPFSVHKILFKENILIVENLTNLDQLIGKSPFNLTALPINFDAEGSPVRVVAQA